MSSYILSTQPIISPAYPDVEEINFHNENWTWHNIYNQVQWGLNEYTAPRAYRINDYFNGKLQFRAVITQRNEEGSFKLLSSVITIYSYELLGLGSESKCWTLPNVIKVVFTPPGSHTNRNLDMNLDLLLNISSFLERFNSLLSVTIPIDFLVSDYDILLSLRDELQILEITSSDWQATRHDPDRLESILILGLTSTIRQQLHKVIIPVSAISPGLVRFFGDMPNLQYLKISPVGGYDGNYFVDMIAAHRITSAHCFYPLRVINVNTQNLHPSRLRILKAHFPNIEYE